MNRKATLLLALFTFSFLVAAIPKAEAATIETTRTFSSLSYDGYLADTDADYKGSGVDAWDTQWSNQKDDTNTSIVVGQKYAGGWYTVYRAFLFFDTSSIQDEATITSATLSVKLGTNASDTDFNLTIQHGNNRPNIPIDLDDYWKDYYSGNGGNRSTTEITVLYDYWNITLNSEGQSWISKIGTTKLPLRSSIDINGTEPTGSEYIMFYSAEAGEVHSPKLHVTYQYEGYVYILHGAYNEEGTRDGAINCTLYKSTETPETIELDGTENMTTESVPIAFKFELDNNHSRTYYIMDEFEEIYVVKPSDPYYTYYVTMFDFVGITNGYLETLININGTDRVVERWKITKLTDIPFTLTMGHTYKFRLICDEGTYNYGGIMAKDDYYFEFTVDAQTFPADYTSFGMNISVSATRENATWIQVLYNDNGSLTTWTYVEITSKTGTVAYSSNTTIQSFTINWYSAANTTSYIVKLTIQHSTLGTLYYSKVLAAPGSGTSPFDFSFLGDWPISPTQVVGFFIVLLFGSMSSTKNVGIGLGLTAVMAAVLCYVGWLDIPATTLTVAVTLAFMVAFAVHKRGT